jgi:uncharacterized membrane protein
MLTDSETRFVTWWEENRLKEKKVFKQWLVGLPLGLLFGVPIFLNFFSGWYKRAVMVRNAQIVTRDFNPVVLIIAVLMIISFVAIFSKKHKWEMNEQRYKELKAKVREAEL